MTPAEPTPPLLAPRRGWSRRGSAVVVLAAVALVALSWRRPAPVGATDGLYRWVPAYADSVSAVAFDTANIRLYADETWFVSYRQDHAAPRFRKGEPYDREVTRSLLWCDSLFFKVVAVDLSMGDAPPVSQQRVTDAELADQRWQRVERGTADEKVARATCAVIAARRAEVARPR